MLYNKNQFKQVNDKKVLHKIKKHWVTLSVALLGLIGGGTLAATNVNADVNPDVQNNNNYQASNHSLHNQQSQLIDNQDNHSNQIQVQNNNINVHTINERTSQLHNQILKDSINEANANKHILGNTKSESSKLNVSASNSIMSESTSQSVNINRVNSSHATSTADSIMESSLAASTSASMTSKGEHIISVSPSICSFMMSGASTIASYNQVAENNKNATLNYLNNLGTTNNSSLASEEAFTKSEVQRFYDNGRNKSTMAMNSEAAHDIKLWGKYPIYFTLFKANPESIENNVKSYYEPIASEGASLAGSIENQVKLLGAPQQISKLSSESAVSLNKNTSSATSSVSTSSTSINLQSGTKHNSSIAMVNNNIQSTINTINSYDQEASSYINVVTTDLNDLNVSGNSSMASEKSEARGFASVDTGLLSKDNTIMNSLDNQADMPNISHNNSFMSNLTGELSAASEVDADASLIVSADVIPLDNQASEDVSNSTSASQSASISASISTSTSASISAVESTSVSVSTSASASISAYASLSMSASVSESSYVSSAYASVLASGGHIVSVSPSVRSAMLSGAAEVASYDQIIKSNAIATVDELNKFNTSDNSALTSKKAEAKKYILNFYNNPQNEKAIITASEAAQGIKLWGEDPRFFTIYKASPGSIVNNVLSFYEPNASVAASLTGSVEAKVMSLSTSQPTSQSVSESATPRSMNSSSYVPDQQNSSMASSVTSFTASSNVTSIKSAASMAHNNVGSSSTTTSNVGNINVNLDNAIPVQAPIHWFYVGKTCLAHNHMSSVGKIEDYSYVLHKGDVAKILKTFVIRRHNHAFYRYEISINGHKYFVTGNSKYTNNEYIQPKELKHERKAIIQVPCFMYNSPMYSNDHRIKKIRRGQAVTIKRIIHIGRKGHFMTRFELSNGMFITANRKFIKLI